MNNLFTKRLIIGKGSGFLFGLIAFFAIGYILPDVSLSVRIGVLLWYTLMGAIIAVFGVMDRHPLFDVRIPAWLRGAVIGGVMNTVLMLIAYDAIEPHLVTATMFTTITPMWLVIEGALVGMFIDLLATYKTGEGEELCSKQ